MLLPKKSDTVSIVGLYRQDLAGESYDSLREKGDIWTMGDWYRPYPWLYSPDVVFNLHDPAILDDLEHRFPGDWKSFYQNCGAKIVVPGEHLAPWQQIIEHSVSYERLIACLNDYPGGFACSISCAITLAVEMGYKKVIIRGCRLRDDEFKYQVAGILRAIKIANKHGVEVECEYLDEWDSRAVDWGEVCGITGHYFKTEVRMFIRIKVETGLKTYVDEGILLSDTEKKGE